MTPTVSRTDDGTWAVLGTLGLAGIGIATGSPLLVAAATVPLWFAASALLANEPEGELSCRRQFVDSAASTAVDEEYSGDPGERVGVEMTVENTGSEPLVDVRVIDGVPEELPVVDGESTTATTLGPGETETIHYAVELRRGEHRFGDATTRISGLSGAFERTWTESVSGAATLSCHPGVESVPLGDGTNDYAGEVPTDEGGRGVEFHAVREYEPGDPVNSIDWRRYANSRELATVEFRAERSTRSVCIVDGRGSQFRSAANSELTAASLSVHAASRTAETLIDAGHPTGIVRMRPGDFDVVEPGTGAETQVQIRNLLTYPFDIDHGTRFYSWQQRDPVETLPAILPGEAQVYLYSAFTDDEPVNLVERLRTRGYDVCVISPDVTAGDTTAIRLEALARQSRLERARLSGARVVDWDRDKKLALLLQTSLGGVTA